MNILNVKVLQDLTVVTRPFLSDTLACAAFVTG